MRVSEYALLEEAFNRSFGFMLNRVWDVYGLGGDPHDRRQGDAEDKCFTEFIIALEEMSVELEEAHVDGIHAEDDEKDLDNQPGKS